VGGVLGGGAFGVAEHERGEHGDELRDGDGPLRGQALQELLVGVSGVSAGKHRPGSFDMHLPHH